jgi:cellulose biosynthesis protein BcsQ
MDAYEETLRKIHGPQVFETVLPLAAAYRQAMAERTPICMKKGKNKAQTTIVALASELDRRMLDLRNRSKEAA